MLAGRQLGRHVESKLLGRDPSDRGQGFDSSGFGKLKVCGPLVSSRVKQIHVNSSRVVSNLDDCGLENGFLTRIYG